MKECKSSQFIPQSGPSVSYNKPDDSYKSKYKKLKAQVALLSQQMENNNNNKCMIATTEDKWVPSDDSSVDEEEERDCCFMALADQEHLIKDDVTSGRWVDIVIKKVSDYDRETDPELKLDIAEALNSDLIFVETVRFEMTQNLETDFSEISILQAKLKELQDIELAFKAQVLVTEQLVQEKHDLEIILGKEKQVIKSWLETKKPYDAGVNQFPSQKRAYLDGNTHVAALIPVIDRLPEEVKPSTIYDEPKTPKGNIVSPVQLPEVKTGASQMTAPVKKVKQNKPLPQSSSKEPQVQKKKTPSQPKPKVQSPGKAQVSSEETILLRLESQFQLLARQVQSCNARLNNFEGTSSGPKQNSKPFSKKEKNIAPVEKIKKKVSKLSTPVIFTEKSITEESELNQILPGIHLAGSREPISRWVPKTN